VPHEEEFNLSNLIVKLVPHKFMPTNRDHEAVDYVTIEIHRKGLLRTKLVKKTKYDPLPILTIRSFLGKLTNIEK